MILAPIVASRRASQHELVASLRAQGFRGASRVDGKVHEIDSSPGSPKNIRAPRWSVVANRLKVRPVPSKHEGAWRKSFEGRRSSTPTAAPW